MTPAGPRRTRRPSGPRPPNWAMPPSPSPSGCGAGTSAAVLAAVDRFPVRDLVTRSEAFPLNVERDAAGRGSWYEFFPRSEGAVQDPDSGHWTSGNFRTAANRLDAVAAMGFDVMYLPPIHPIGKVNRKGPNNTLVAGPEDPGSPWAIGSDEGGHDAIHPDLGSFEDFDAFVARAGELGLEVALDLALQCAPDHPWATRAPGMVHHPGGRQHRLCGKPAQEIPGHLPAELRQRPGGAVPGDPAHCPALDRPRRAPVPGGQPAHQAGLVLGMADREGEPGASRTWFSWPRPSPGRP